MRRLTIFLSRFLPPIVKKVAADLGLHIVSNIIYDLVMHKLNAIIHYESVIHFYNEISCMKRGF
jgi:hypothetical protein